jgi:hypothetical protein
MNWKQNFTGVLVLCVALTCANAQTSSSPATFTSFWKTFKAAMARNDKQAVADVTKLPFLFESQERDRAGFIKIYDQLFTRKIRRCIATAKPVKEGENYDVFCGGLIFYFGKDTDGKYKLLEFGVND